ncbi:hypothetical protein [Streptomyces natalensis]|uniref:Uncharacterized protein n=1 Tax=Streptomyces natalensis ATCC 27448 TaxID=1240678 RepID=A0A0D7CN39_9ACTN|nr:hypothetical protein [Streptomyces natalensis]KIZ16832.1 hypothetical protein SNA_17690 [Streptomyces natalensis ATCC 27448]
MPDISELLEQASPREATIRVCLSGDAGAELEALESEVGQLGEWQPTSLGEANPVFELQERIEVARQRVRESAVEFRFRALGHRAYSNLLAAHPAPEGSKEPYDAGTFLPAVLAACCVEPSLTPAQVDRLLDVVNDGTARTLFAAALAVNEEPSPLPFS